MHIHAYADLELCWSDVSWAWLYVVFFFAKVMTGPYFTYVYLMQRPTANTFDTTFHLRYINKVIKSEKKDKVMVWYETVNK